MDFIRARFSSVREFYPNLQPRGAWARYTRHDNVTRFGAEYYLGEFENANYFARGTLTVTLDMELAGHPQTTATLTVNRSGLDSGEAVLALVRADKQWSLKVVKADGEEVSAIEATSPEGAKMVLERDDNRYVHGHVSVNGKRMGTIATSQSGLLVIRWGNGEVDTLY